MVKFLKYLLLILVGVLLGLGEWMFNTYVGTKLAECLDLG